MKLNGNNLIATAIFTLVSTPIIAAPDLIEFSAGTPAKAAEVNSNFSDLKTFATEIDGRVTVIENSGRSSAINELQNKVSTLEALNLGTELPNLSNKVTALESVDHTTPITNLSSRIAPIEALNLGTELPALTNKVSALEAVDHTTPITTLQNRVTPLETATSNLETKVTALENVDHTTPIADLQTRVSTLEDVDHVTTDENQQTQIDALLDAHPDVDPFTTAVYGDGELIGYANMSKYRTANNFLTLKTDYGHIAIGRSEGVFVTRSYDPLTNSIAGSYSVKYSDSNCTMPVGTVFTYGLLITKVAGEFDAEQLIVSETDTYYAASGTQFSYLDTLYNLSADGLSCTSESIPSYMLAYPITNISAQLKPSFTTISVEGYSLN